MGKMTELDMALLFAAWDRLDGAIQRTTVSLPSNLSDSVARLDHERIAMRSVLQSIFRSAGRAALQERDNG